jgi:FHA domain
MGTIAAPEPETPAPSFAEVFARIFPRLAELHAGFARDGLLAVAVWEGREIDDYLHVPLADDPEFVLVGRHGRCDLSLGRDSALSLRHAVIAARVAGGELRIRFLDLQSGSGLVTEDGRRCEALAADGAMFVRLGRYHLFLLPTGSLSQMAWAATAEDTWKTIPERIYRDNRLAPREPGRVTSGARVRRLPSIATEVLEPPGPLRPFRPAAGARGAPVADVELEAGAGSERFLLHESELERGILLGRYDRCQLGVAGEKMSRIHLLVIRDGPQIFAVDTASTNGTSLDGRLVRSARLHHGTRLLLGLEVSLRWRAPGPVSSPEGAEPGKGPSS